MDDVFCLFIWKSIYLESFLEKCPNSKYLFTDKTDKKAPNSLKNNYRNRLKTVVWTKKEFEDIIDEIDLDKGSGGKSLGTHSGRKFPANHARNKGCIPDEIEIRGRWKKNGRRVVFRYIDVSQLYEDAKVAAALCTGGPVMYVVKDGIELTDAWLFENVNPAIRRRFPNDTRLCRVLGLALLYSAMKETIMMPDSIRKRIKDAYNLLRNDEEQPVKKVPLHVFRMNAKLCIEPVSDDATATIGVLSSQNELAQTVLIRLDRMEQLILTNHMDVKSEIADWRRRNDQKFRTINNNIRCFAGTIEGGFMQQHQQVNNGQRLWRMNDSTDPAADEVGVDEMATLSQNPRSLKELWLEYKYGLDGRKPAKDFTTKERNQDSKMKQKYYRRNIFWTCLAKMIRQGSTVDLAIEKVRECYGFRCSVTKILGKMIADRKTGGHPNLA